MGQSNATIIGDGSSPIPISMTFGAMIRKLFAGAIMIDTAVFVRQMNSTSGGSLFLVGSRSVICGNEANGVLQRCP